MSAVRLWRPSKLRYKWTCKLYLQNFRKCEPGTFGWANDVHVCQTLVNVWMERLVTRDTNLPDRWESLCMYPHTYSHVLRNLFHICMRLDPEICRLKIGSLGSGTKSYNAQNSLRLLGFGNHYAISAVPAKHMAGSSKRCRARGRCTCSTGKLMVLV